MFKKLLLISISLLILVSVFSSLSYASEPILAWYIKRNGNKMPKLSPDQELINKYNAYFLDTSLSDDSPEKIIYLTYDAGYENGNIEKTLDILKSEGVPAAFFILDNILLKNSDLVTRMINEGHTVCNHTTKHKNHANSTKKEISEDLSALEALYKEKTGCEMEKYFRFPEGKYSEKSLAYVSELGYKTIFWSFAYDDWDNNRQMNEEKAKQKILANTHNGAVFLFHPTSKTNVNILKDLIREWKACGYQFGTLGQLTEKE